MTTRKDVERLTGATRDLTERAKDYLDQLVRSWDLTRPEVVRDLLLEVVPTLVEQYGDVAAVAAAEWYEETRAAQVEGAFAARPTTRVIPREQVQSSVRALAGGLWDGELDKTLSLISGAVGRYISYMARDTVARNVERDPARPRFARVPRGAKTCAWCLMLASRGWVYHSKKSAGEIAEHYHDECDCAVVPEWDRENAHVGGYDPDKLFAMYEEAHESGDTLSDTAKRLRRLFPDRVKDGVVEQTAA